MLLPSPGLRHMQPEQQTTAEKQLQYVCGEHSKPRFVNENHSQKAKANKIVNVYLRSGME